MKAIFTYLNDRKRMGELIEMPPDPHQTLDYIKENCFPILQLVVTLNNMLGQTAMMGFMAMFKFVNSMSKIDHSVKAEFDAAMKKFNDEDWCMTQSEKFQIEGTEFPVKSIMLAERFSANFTDIVNEAVGQSTKDENESTPKVTLGMFICIEVFRRALKK